MAWSNLSDIVDFNTKTYAELADSARKDEQLRYERARQAEQDKRTAMEFAWRQREQDKKVEEQNALSAASKLYSQPVANPEMEQYLAAHNEGALQADQAIPTRLNSFGGTPVSNYIPTEQNKADLILANKPVPPRMIEPSALKAQVDTANALRKQGHAALANSITKASIDTATHLFEQAFKIGDYKEVANIYSTLSGNKVTITPNNEIKVEFKDGQFAISDGKKITAAINAGMPIQEASQKYTAIIGERPDQDKTLDTKYVHNRTNQLMREKGISKEVAELQAIQEKEAINLENKQKYKESPTFIIPKEDKPTTTTTPGVEHDKDGYFIRENGLKKYLSADEVRIKALQNKEDTPTAGTKEMMQSVPGVLSLINKVRNNLKKVSTGPLSSRYQEVMAGRIGAPNEDFTKLRTDTKLLYTKLMKMHVGSRGGEKMMEHFKNIIDSGTQSSTNMLAALEEIEAYANDTAKSHISDGQTPVNNNTIPSKVLNTKIPTGAFIARDKAGTPVGYVMNGKNYNLDGTMRK